MRDVEAGGGRCVRKVSSARVGFVDDTGRSRRVRGSVAEVRKWSEDGFEAAPARPRWPRSAPRMSNAVGVGGDVGGIGDEDELGTGVDEAAN